MLRAFRPARLVAVGGRGEFAELGSTRIGALGGVSSPVGTIGIGAMAAGLLTCAALVPFDGLAPRASARAPAPAATLVSLVGRIAGFAALLRIAAATSASGAFVPDWRASIAVV